MAFDSLHKDEIVNGFILVEDDVTILVDNDVCHHKAYLI